MNGYLKCGFCRNLETESNCNTGCTNCGAYQWVETDVKRCRNCGGLVAECRSNTGCEKCGAFMWEDHC